MLPPAAGAMVEVSDANPCAAERIGKIVSKENRIQQEKWCKNATGDSTWLMPLTRPMVLLLALRAGG
jgi:hypothetical protein